MIQVERKQNRLKDYDYSQDGFYFVTICTKNRENFWGEIINETMILNDLGRITQECWLNIPKHFFGVQLDEFVIMPNHIHGILVIKNGIVKNNNFGHDTTRNCNLNSNISITVGNNDRCSLQKNRNMELLPKIISQFKSSVTREIRKKYDDFYFAWQKSFHDHIIRDEESLDQIRNYIMQNPVSWTEDQDNLVNCKHENKLGNCFVRTKL